MQSVRSRIWTLVAVSVSCDDNHYTMGNIIVRPKFELAYYDVAVQHVSHYTAETPPFPASLGRRILTAVFPVDDGLKNIFTRLQCFVCLLANYVHLLFHAPHGLVKEFYDVITTWATAQLACNASKMLFFFYTHCSGTPGWLLAYLCLCVRTRMRVRTCVSQSVPV